MGIVNFSIPKELVKEVAAELSFDNFLETGTYKGGTTLWAAGYFKKVITIEIDKNLADDFVSKLPIDTNITCINGDSRNVLPEIISTMKGRVICWLDGHWCSGAGGKEAECPLMEELLVLKETEQPFIMIDDARCFLGPMPSPHDSTHWPTIAEIFNFVSKHFPEYETTIIDDVILIMPNDVKKIVYRYWQNTFNERFYSVRTQAPSIIQRLKNRARKIIVK